MEHDASVFALLGLGFELAGFLGEEFQEFCVDHILINGGSLDVAAHDRLADGEFVGHPALFAGATGRGERGDGGFSVLIAFKDGGKEHRHVVLFADLADLLNERKDLFVVNIFVIKGERAVGFFVHEMLKLLAG